MGESKVNLATLIGSRICHDLISPVGAITNGLELLEMSGLQPGPEMDLIADSVGNAAARIRFFRIAYGVAGEQDLSADEVSNLLADLTGSGRVRVDWTVQGSAPRAEVRLAFLALQCCESAMPLGGNVRMERQDGAWSIAGMADIIAVEPTLWEGLSRPGAIEKVTPAQVQFALLPAVAADMGRRIGVSARDTAVTITF
ncbi:MAG: histidine phosphotransferase family protein [Pseudomonadota bacterium]